MALAPVHRRQSTWTALKSARPKTLRDPKQAECDVLGHVLGARGSSEMIYLTKAPKSQVTLQAACGEHAAVTFGARQPNHVRRMLGQGDVGAGHRDLIWIRPARGLGPVASCPGANPMGWFLLGPSGAECFGARRGRLRCRMPFCPLKYRVCGRCVCALGRGQTSFARVELRDGD